MTKAPLTIAAVAAASLGFAGAAHAQAIDLNLGYTRFDDAEADAITGRIGARFLPNFGVEGEGSLSIDDDSGFDGEIGLFAKGVLPLTGGELFGRVGYADADRAGGGDSDGLAWGAGGQLNLNARSGVRADYTRYDFGYDEDALSLSYVFRLN